MDIKKIILYFALAILAVGLWDAWQKDYSPKAEKPAVQKTTPAPSSGANYVPQTFNPGSATTQPQTEDTSAPATHKITHGNRIEVKTDVLDVNISEAGGNLIDAKLLKYPVSLQQKNVPVQILNSNPKLLYIAQSGLTNIGDQSANLKFSAPKDSYILQPGENTIAVTLTATAANGLQVEKIYTFTRNKYAIDVAFKVKNDSAKTWQGSVYNQIVRRNIPEDSSFHSRSYNGASISTSGEPYKKLPYKDLDKGDISTTAQGGWVAMQQHYFLSAWVPPSNKMNHFYSRVFTPESGAPKIYTVGYVTSQMTLAPGQQGALQSTFYVGPEIKEYLDAVAKNLALTIDYGWLWFLSVAIFWVMAKIHTIVGNWGWSIVIVTILIKLLFYKLSDKSYRSMVKMREMQPRLEALKERYGDDKQALSRATMELYRKEKANPMSGCLPMLIQIPVFFALYFVLIEAVQLRQAPFILWIHDLSVKDPYYVLPILMGISMFVQQKLSPPPPDPTQAKVMMLLPVVFTVFFLSFPAGLVLYWLTNNVVSILHQWYVMKTYDPTKEKKKKRKKHKKK